MTFLALIHLLLIIVLFNKDTPMQLIAESTTDTATEELHKIYTYNDLRVTIYRQVQSIVEKNFLRFPSYRELFSKKYRTLLIKGVGLIFAMNFCETFLFDEIEYISVSKNKDMLFNTAFLGVFIIVSIMRIVLPPLMIPRKFYI